MDQGDIDKIERIIKEREHSHHFLFRRNSKSYRSFLALEKNAYTTNKLERKHKELIALGISIIQNCESCIEWHVHQALEFGATFDQLFEAVDVGIEMGGGPATVSSRFVIKVVEYYKNRMFRALKSDQDFISCTTVLHRSFKTVADEFDLNQNNAPTHPSKVTVTALKESVEKGIVLYGLYVRGNMIGCIGIEQSPEEHKYYIEKVAVVPEMRHNGYGTMLMDFACDTIRQFNGTIVSIGIINENTVLKNWYIKYGFIEKGLKRFDHLPFEVCFMEKEL